MRRPLCRIYLLHYLYDFFFQFSVLEMLKFPLLQVHAPFIARGRKEELVVWNRFCHNLMLIHSQQFIAQLNW